MPVVEIRVPVDAEMTTARAMEPPGSQVCPVAELMKYGKRAA
jgi:hypothetical protein